MAEHNSFRQPSIQKQIKPSQTSIKPLMDVTSERSHLENLSLPSDVAMMNYRESSCVLPEVRTCYHFRNAVFTILSEAGIRLLEL